MRNTFPVLASSIGHPTAVCPFAANLRQNYMQQLKPIFFSNLYLISSYLGEGKLIFCCMGLTNPNFW